MRTQLYEGMFLVDNDAVRADFQKTKSVVTDVITKHDGTINTARRWDERRLAYPIEGHLRATYVLVFFTMDTQSVSILRRDLELSETVLRYLIRSVEVVPEGEQALHEAELAPDFVAPAPPEEDEVVPEPAPEAPRERREAAPAKAGDADSEKTDKAAEPEKTDKAEKTEAPATAGATESTEG